MTHTLTTPEKLLPRHSQPDLKADFGPAVTIALTSLSGLILIGFHNLYFGWPLLAVTLALALLQQGRARARLLLIIVSVALLGVTDINTNITTIHIVGMGATLILAVAVPYFTLKYVFHDDLIRFPFRLGRQWYRYEIGYVAVAGVIAYLLLPVYLQTTGAYHNWTVLPGADNLIRLFMGTNALGIWDELFFVITVLAVFRRYLPFVWANLAQATLWTSFLYELGFRGWAPLVIFPFALLQGYIFKRTDSLLYIVTIHLTVDFVLYLALIHAYYPAWLPIFIT